jgi:hypothetical protein
MKIQPCDEYKKTTPRLEEGGGPKAKGKTTWGTREKNYMLKGGKTPKEEGKFEIRRGEKIGDIPRKNPLNKKATQLKKG